jgi:4-diphosphocytidyl-2-C-methyl-D-erythritol kinase
MFPVEGLYDEVEVVRCDGNSSFRVEGIEVDCDPEQNICMKALRLMQSRYGIGQVAITLTKRVPFGAGLGGGSADGTAVILALNDIFSLALDEATLISLAAELGSDTAFFVRNTPQLCEGRGEIMTPVELNLKGCTLVLIKPDESVSTREAYAGVKPAIPARSLTERLSEPIEQWQESVRNDFEESVFTSHPRLARIKQQLLDGGATYAAMSGSGSTLFGIFTDKEAAEKFRSVTPYIFDL